MQMETRNARIYVGDISHGTANIVADRPPTLRRKRASTSARVVGSLRRPKRFAGLGVPTMVFNGELFWDSDMLIGNRCNR